MENGNSEASGDDDNLENFTTIDSVGDGDGRCLLLSYLYAFI